MVLWHLPTLLTIFGSSLGVFVFSTLFWAVCGPLRQRHDFA
jgi:hypothetical protein